MTYVYVLKEFTNPDCNTSLTIGVYRNREDAIRERDKMRAEIGDRIVCPLSLEWDEFRPRDLIDVVEYELR